METKMPFRKTEYFSGNQSFLKVKGWNTLRKLNTAVSLPHYKQNYCIESTRNQDSCPISINMILFKEIRAIHWCSSLNSIVFCNSNKWIEMLHKLARWTPWLGWFMQHKRSFSFTPRNTRTYKALLVKGLFPPERSCAIFYKLKISHKKWVHTRIISTFWLNSMMRGRNRRGKKVSLWMFFATQWARRNPGGVFLCEWAVTLVRGEETQTWSCFCSPYFNPRLTWNKTVTLPARPKQDLQRRSQTSCLSGEHLVCSRLPFTPTEPACFRLNNYINRSSLAELIQLVAGWVFTIYVVKWMLYKTLDNYCQWFTHMCI